MTRPATPAELQALTDEQREAYRAGAAFSFGEGGLAPIHGRPGEGAYVVRQGAALRETLTARKEANSDL